MSSSITAWGHREGRLNSSLTHHRSPATALSLQKLHSSAIHFVINFFYTEAFQVLGSGAGVTEMLHSPAAAVLGCSLNSQLLQGQQAES